MCTQACAHEQLYPKSLETPRNSAGLGFCSGGALPRRVLRRHCGHPLSSKLSAWKSQGPLGRAELENARAARLAGVQQMSRKLCEYKKSLPNASGRAISGRKSSQSLWNSSKTSKSAPAPSPTSDFGRQRV